MLFVRGDWATTITTPTVARTAGTSPVTIASGRKRAVLARHVRSRGIYGALDDGPSAPSTSPGARTFYDHHRGAAGLHHKALPAFVTAPSASCTCYLRRHDGRQSLGTPTTRRSISTC
jgi:hypothetical protein